MVATSAPPTNRPNLFLRQHPRRRLRRLINPVHQLILCRYIVPRQPVHHVRFPAHRPDIHDLLQPKQMRRHPAIHRIRQFPVMFLQRLDDRRRVHPRPCPERIPPDHRIIWRYHCMRRLRHLFAVRLQICQVVINQSHQPEIHQQQFDRRIPHALSQRQRHAMHLIRSRRHRRQRIRHRQSAIPVPMPVHANSLPRRFHHLSHRKSHQVKRALRRRMPHRVAQHNRPRSAANRRLVQPLHRIRVRPHRIFGHIHHRQPMRHREPHRLLRRPLQMFNRPVLHQSPYRARPQKRRRLNRNPHLLRNLHNRPYIRFHRARRAIRPDAHVIRDNLPRQPLHRLRHARSRTRQTKVHRINVQRFHEMQYFDFFFNGRIGHRRRLQPISQRLVVHHHPRTRRYRHRPAAIPIVNPFAPRHAESLPHPNQLAVPPAQLFPSSFPNSHPQSAAEGAPGSVSYLGPGFLFPLSSFLFPLSLRQSLPSNRRGGCPRFAFLPGSWVPLSSFLFPVFSFLFSLSFVNPYPPTDAEGAPGSLFYLGLGFLFPVFSFQSSLSCFLFPVPFYSASLRTLRLRVIVLLLLYFFSFTSSTSFTSFISLVSWSLI